VAKVGENLKNVLAEAFHFMEKKTDPERLARVAKVITSGRRPRNRRRFL
jgi:hypothetical protein